MIKSISVLAFLFLITIQINSALASNISKGSANRSKNNPTPELLTMAVSAKTENSNFIEVLVHSKVYGKSQVIVLNGKTGKIVHTSSVRLVEGENKVIINTEDFPEGFVYKVILRNADSKANASTVFRKGKLK